MAVCLIALERKWIKRSAFYLQIKGVFETEDLTLRGDGMLHVKGVRFVAVDALSIEDIAVTAYNVANASVIQANRRTETILNNQRIIVDKHQRQRYCRTQWLRIGE